ncbi:hypothetical protein [Tabrizicola sp.]|uniref:hypothetical protein n=1 Tax=Tabrizicola sp. TaxID=2005166 RepID=UPI002634DDDD|nr:hypothetical protein [Tabrizicola sp.]MDM7932217.1 hypothetical protein [Tabrizicola sp.]
MTTVPKEKAVSASGKVLTLGNSAIREPDIQPMAPRGRHYFWLSFLVCVLLPVTLVAVHFGTIATDRFASRAGFSIRGIDTNAGLDGIGALTGLPSSGSTTADSYIVLSYLGSRALLEQLDQNLGLRQSYSGPEIDFISRLSPDATIEDFVAYWNRRITTQFDPASGIIEFEVQSFSAGHARDIAALVLTLTQTLVNDLSETARRDALRFAREEVALQETRLREALATVRDFRAVEQSVNPSASAALEIELIASLESRLIDVNARIDALRQTLDENAPSLAALRRNAEALSAQIDERRQAIGNDMLSPSGTSAVTQQLARYEALEVERSLAQQAYASALVSLEQARRDADRQQRYLAIHLRPQIAEAAEYPRRLRNLLLAAFGLVVAWGIGTLVTYSVRDHLT